MRAVVQRVSGATVSVDGNVVGHADRGLLAYLGVGALMGLTFGGLILGLGVQGGTIAPTAAALLPAAVNELIFPALCAGVVYISTRAGALLGGATNN